MTSSRVLSHPSPSNPPTKSLSRLLLVEDLKNSRIGGEDLEEAWKNSVAYGEPAERSAVYQTQLKQQQQQRQRQSTNGTSNPIRPQPVEQTTNNSNASVRTPLPFPTAKRDTRKSFNSDSESEDDDESFARFSKSTRSTSSKSTISPNSSQEGGNLSSPSTSHSNLAGSPSDSRHPRPAFRSKLSKQYRTKNSDSESSDDENIFSPIIELDPRQNHTAQNHKASHSNVITQGRKSNRPFVDSDASDDDDVPIRKNHLSNEEDDDSKSIRMSNEFDDQRSRPYQQSKYGSQSRLPRLDSSSSTSQYSSLAKASDEMLNDDNDDDEPLAPPPLLGYHRQKSASLGEINIKFSKYMNNPRKSLDMLNSDYNENSGGFRLDPKKNRSVDNIRSRLGPAQPEDSDNLDHWRRSVTDITETSFNPNFDVSLSNSGMPEDDVQPMKNLRPSANRRSGSAMELLNGYERDKEQRRMEARNRFRDSVEGRRFSGEPLIDLGARAMPATSRSSLPIASKSVGLPNPHQRQQERARESLILQQQQQQQIQQQHRKRRSGDLSHSSMTMQTPLSSQMVMGGYPAMIPQGYMLVPVAYPIASMDGPVPLMPALRRPRSSLDLKGRRTSGMEWY